MNKEEILNKVKENYKYHSFELLGSRIPTRIGRTNLYELRNKLLTNRSPYENMYLEDFYKIRSKTKSGRSGTCVEQFPIIIDDRDLWIDCCRKYDAYNSNDRNNFPLIKKKFLIPDLYLPYLKTIIEVDYGSTHLIDIDKVRDLYLFKRYRITTFRVVRYGKDENQSELYRLYTAFLLKNTLYKSSVPYDTFDYLEFYLKDFEQRYKLILDGLLEPTKEFLSYTKKK